MSKRPAPNPAPEARRPSFLRSRGGVLVLWLLLVTTGVLVYSGASWPVVAYRLLFDGGVAIVWLLSAAGIGAALLGVVYPAVATAPATLRFVTATALGLGILSLATLGLGLAGWLNFTTAVALVGAGILIGPRRLARPRGRFTDLTNRARASLAAPARWEWLWLATAPFAAIAIVGAMVPPGVLWTPNDPHPYDVLEYHLQVPREWYEAGQILPLRHNVFSYFPFNVEVHYLLAMHLRGGPWAGMYLAQLMHVAFVALTVAAVYSLAPRHNDDPRDGRATIAAVITAAFPWLTLLAPIAYNEGGLLLFGTLSVGWALRALTSPHNRLRQYALAGLFAGFACGAKLTAVPTVLLAIPFVCLALSGVLRSREPIILPFRRQIIGAALLLACGLASFSPWLVRNMTWAGNPVFPEAMPLLGRAHFSDVQVERWQRAHAPTESQRSLGGRLSAGYRQVIGDWRYAYCLPLVVAVAVLMSNRPIATWFLLALLLLLAVFWLAFTHLQSRFFVLAIPVTGLLLAQAQWTRWRRAAVVIPLTLAALVAAPGVLRLHNEMNAYLFGSPAEPGGLADLLGRERLHEVFTPPALAEVPDDATLELVGEARAFWYGRRMRQLRYRTVFDVHGASDSPAGWTLPPEPSVQSPTWLLVDPIELRRLSNSYWLLPPLDPRPTAGNTPYLLPARPTSGPTTSE